MNTLEIKKEFQRMLLEDWGQYLADADYEVSIEEGYGSYELNVKLPCPSEVTAAFSVNLETDREDQPINIIASCFLPFADENISEGMTIEQGLSTEDVCDLLLIPFLNGCAYKEFSAVTRAEIINDLNLDNFAALLSDEALTEEGEFAVGFRIKDEDEMEIAAAASFFFTEDELIVDSIQISEDYEIPGFEEYIAMYIYETVTEAEE